MRPEPGALERIPALPTGTVTFLFTDIEGSTQKWERHRDGMKAAVARHERIMNDAVSRHGGLVFKTVGDAFCVAFPTAPQALGAAIHAQEALAKEDFASVDGLRVRMGVHSGHAEERNADYFGPAVNRVARLMSIGHGGQVLLSAATRDLAHSDLPSGTSLIDLGSQRLKDLTEPEQVWQLNITGLPTEFPPLRSLDALPNNLPIQRTTFVGRDHDVAQVKELVGRHRLLTLVGSGGVGKTRVALQAGADLLDHFPDGVWFVDFAPITDLELVSSVIAQVLGMSQQEGKRIDESIPQFLRRKKLLLIFDNCEHVIDTVAAIAAAILNAAADVRIMSTSRQALDIGGEVVHRLPSLSVPSEAGTLHTEQALKYGAVALFVDRATAADTRFALTNDTAPIVANICRRLDGIPLAIELAAARVKVLSIPNLAQRLNERFKILTGGGRDVLPRQKTLSALIDWSYDLLTPQEQLLFRRLSIFASGFGLDAATTVCSGEGLDEVEVLDLLTSLTGKSLVVADTTGEQERYHLLESTRAYALDKLTAAGDREQLARCHAQYFRDLAQTADERFGTGSRFAWLDDVEVHLDNYRAALEWCITHGSDDVVGGAIAGALERLWLEGGLAVEGRYWIGLALEQISEAKHPRVSARLWRAQACVSSGKASIEAAEQAVRLYASAGDDRGAARTQGQLAWNLYEMGRLDEANEMAEQALVRLREVEDRWGVSRALRVQAGVATARGDVVAARDLYARALTSFKALGDEIGIASTLGGLAELEFVVGHPDEALRLASKVLDIESRFRSSFYLADNFFKMAAYRTAVGDAKGGSEAARRGLHFAREAQDGLLAAIAVQHLALIAALEGNTCTSARLVGFVEAQVKALGWQRQTLEKWSYDKSMTALHHHLSEDEIAKLVAEGAAWSEDQAVEEALKV